MLNKRGVLPENIQNYEITDRIQVGENDYCIGYNKDHPIVPYVVWSVDYTGDAVSHGHYCKTKEEAMLNLFERASRGIGFPEEKSLAMHLLDDYDRAILDEEFTKLNLREDILANLDDYLCDVDLQADVAPERFANDPYFMETVSHYVFNRDHSEDNERIRQIIEDTIKDEFPFLLPELYSEAEKPMDTYPFELALSKETCAFLDRFISDFESMKQENKLLPEVLDIEIPSNKHQDSKYVLVIHPTVTTHQATLEQYHNHNLNDTLDMSVESLNDLINQIEHHQKYRKEEYKLHLTKKPELDRLDNWYVTKRNHYEMMPVAKKLPKGSPVKVVAMDGGRKPYHIESGMPNVTVQTEQGETFVLPEHFLSSKDINDKMKKEPLTAKLEKAEKQKTDANPFQKTNPSKDKDMHQSL